MILLELVGGIITFRILWISAVDQIYYHSSCAEEKVNSLTKVASVKVAEASEALTAVLAADATPKETAATDAVQEAQTALEEIVKADATPTSEDLTAAHTKVEEAEAAVAAANTTETTVEKKAELVKIESSLQAAKKIVNDAIAKADTLAAPTAEA